MPALRGDGAPGGDAGAVAGDGVHDGGAATGGAQARGRPKGRPRRDPVVAAYVSRRLAASEVAIVPPVALPTVGAVTGLPAARDAVEELRQVEGLVRGQFLRLLQDERITARVVKLLTNPPEAGGIPDKQFVTTLVELAKAFLPNRALEAPKQAQAITVNIAGVPRAGGG